MGSESHENRDRVASADIDAEEQKRRRKEQAARIAAERELRLKAQLKANLQRRKVQARARREGAEDDRPGDLAVAPVER